MTKRRTDLVQVERRCPTCKMRFYVPPNEVSPNYAALPLDEQAWLALRRAAEAFDRAALNQEGDDNRSGCGDGESLWPARAFVDWIKPDCIGFRGQGNSVVYDVEGTIPRNLDGTPSKSGVHRHPDPIPWAGDGVHRKSA